jgi:membrane protease YdiL (CAAX protease family)
MVFRISCSLNSPGDAMDNASALVVFLVAAVAMSCLWGRALWYADEQSSLFRRAQYAVMGYSRWRPAQVRSLLLSAWYYGLGLAAITAFATVARLHPGRLFAIESAHLAPTLLGLVAVISLTNLGVDLACRVTRQGPEQFAALREVPWIRGLGELPSGLAPVAGAVGGIIEEVFFRGVLLWIASEKLGIPPWAAVTLVGALFCLQQMLQLRTGFQVMVIGCGCVAISLVGGLLVVLTRSVIPAIICHGSFVIFFLGHRRDEATGAGADPSEALT